MIVDMQKLGWNRHFEAHFAAFKSTAYVPGRVSRVDRGIFHVIHKDGQCVVKVTGKFQFEANSRFEFPSVGDWVVLELETENQSGRIHALLPRQTSLSRKLPGDDSQQQTIAANVNTAFIVCGLDGDFNIRRIERYITICYNGGTVPVIILNKMDLCNDLQEKMVQVREVACEIAICPISVTQNLGLEVLEQYLTLGQTVALFGSSGVGKSSLINYLVGEEKMLVKEVRESDSHGRHTTRHREMIRLAQGCVVIDTPGIRELGMWTDDEEGLQTSFQDIDSLAEQCKFRDCQHAQEPGCAIKQAIASGELPEARMNNYWQMLDEVKQAEEKKARIAKKADRKGRKKK